MLRKLRILAILAVLAAFPGCAFLDGITGSLTYQDPGGTTVTAGNGGVAVNYRLPARGGLQK